ncbi:MAG: haloalkane dehalogenase [Bacteroidia bacterium]|nr:haloalkane dehalogenase [Bacteroidia bacterium]
MKVYQTPPDRFSDLIDFPFQPHYININGLRMHYVDEGQVGSRPVLLLHGVPSWSYLYRHMINKIAVAGYHVIVPDLIGFGKSDKPKGTKYHTYQSHIDWIKFCLDYLHLKDIILFGHDWGSLIGLRIAADDPAMFAGIIISNGMLPIGEQKMHYSFNIWKFISHYSPFLPVDLVIESGMTCRLGKEEKRAYRAPFPSLKYKDGIRALPGLVPVSPDDPESIANRKAWEELKKWRKPFLTIFSDNDPVTRGGDRYLQSKIPGCAGQDHKILPGGHFIQEERSDELTGIIIRFIEMIDSKLPCQPNHADEL